MEKIFRYKEKVIGVYDEDKKEFRKKVDPSKHYMKKHRGYGLDYSIVEQLAPDVKVFIQEPNRTLETTIWQYQHQGVVENFGYGKQVFLATDNF